MMFRRMVSRKGMKLVGLLMRMMTMVIVRMIMNQVVVMIRVGMDLDSRYGECEKSRYGLLVFYVVLALHCIVVVQCILPLCLYAWVKMSGA